MEIRFHKNKQIQSWIWFRYSDDIFIIWTASGNEHDHLFEWPNNFHCNLKFTHERSREEINFLDITVRVNQGEFITDLYCKPTISTYSLGQATLVTENLLLFLVMLWEWEEFVLREVILLANVKKLKA